MDHCAVGGGGVERQGPSGKRGLGKVANWIMVPESTLGGGRALNHKD